VPAVDGDMVLVAEGRDREIDAGRALRARLGLGVFDRPARVAVLLAKLGGLARPFRRNAALPDVALFAVGVALLGRGNDRRIDDLPAFGQEPGADSASSKRANKTSIAGLPSSRARVSASRKVQIVLASGTVSARRNPRKRTNDNRSRIRYSVRSSDRLWLV